MTNVTNLRQEIGKLIDECEKSPNHQVSQSVMLHHKMGIEKLQAEYEENE